MHGYIFFLEVVNEYLPKSSIWSCHGLHGKHLIICKENAFSFQTHTIQNSLRQCFHISHLLVYMDIFSYVYFHLNDKGAFISLWILEWNKIPDSVCVDFNYYRIPFMVWDRTLWSVAVCWVAWRKNLSLAVTEWCSKGLQLWFTSRSLSPPSWMNLSNVHGFHEFQFSHFWSSRICCKVPWQSSEIVYVKYSAQRKWSIKYLVSVSSSANLIHSVMI